MSSHVVILDSSARRATIKTLPGSHLSEVLQQACTKLGLDASQYGLRYDRSPLSKKMNTGSIQQLLRGGDFYHANIGACLGITTNH